MPETNELAARLLAWRKRNDGGHLHTKANGHDPNEIGPQVCVSWDHGGYHEIGCMYAGSTSLEDAEMLCEVFNWAMEQLTPSTQGWYGTREYEADE